LVTEWNNQVGEQVKASLIDNMQMIQQMQANLSARKLDANVDLMKSLYHRLRWAVQATDMFSPQQMQPLPLQLNTTLIRNALTGIANTAAVPSTTVNKSQMEALRAKASAQLDRLQQQQQQQQKVQATAPVAAAAKSRAPPQRKRTAGGAAGGAARRRKKRPEYEESDEEDDFAGGGDDDDDDGDDDAE
jgi:hypothetical protein